MNIDSSKLLRIIISALIFSTLVILLKYISPLNPEMVYITMNLIIVIIINRPNDIYESLTIGVLIGLFSGVFLSLFYFAFLFMGTIFFIIISIVGSIIAYYLFENIFK